MICRTTEYTKAEVAEFEFYKFPGGYSAHETKGEYRFNCDKARQAVNLGPRYFEHTKGAKGGEPLYLEPWEAAIFATIFGWEDEFGARRFRVVYIEVPRGNGKSTICLIIVGVLMFLDDEPGADIFSAAGTRDQAKEVFGPFKMNCIINPELAKITQTYQNSITRISEETGLAIASYKAISADADFQHGGSPHGIIFDELHVQPNRDLWDVLQTGKIKRRQPLTVAITTAGFDGHSICYEQRKWAEGVRDGRITDATFLPVIYAADEKDDWTAPETWRKANPNLGVSIFEKDLAAECEKAKQLPSYENTFKRLHLNIWTEQAVRWLNMKAWDECDEELPDLIGEPCWCGLDLSSTRDLSALAMVFRLPEGRYAAKCHFWIPGGNIRHKSLEDGVPYQEWIDRGLMTATPGDFIDHARIRDDIVRFNELYPIQDIGIDPYNAAQITTELVGLGFNAEFVRQGGITMSPLCKDFERAILGRKLIHGGNPVLRWNASNVSVITDNKENISPIKGAKSTGRIDGIVALIMGLARATAGSSFASGSMFVTV